MMAKNPLAPLHVARPDLYSAIRMALEAERAHAATPSDYAGVVTEAASAHYAERHGPARTAEMLDEIAAAAGILAARLEPEKLED